ncbi:uncharacterized protein ATC70_009398 [Mucor velutinosus]|uniref:Uncharacterized protein n=1 Tax=Mucor velutinosus TaxID=708070 RepID=A0AAN7DKN6_9FUNG|nr:hypothetical protein ATC70_009398 [Mucor velutinosus]
MSTSKPKPPNLQRLKGSYILPDTLRNDAQLNSSILRNAAKDWGNLEEIIDSYLCNSVVWEKTGVEFLSLLQSSFNQIVQWVKQQSSSAFLSLLAEYVKSLVIYYKNDKIKYDVCQLYQQAELRRRVERNSAEAELQAESTMSVLMTRKGKEREDSMILHKRQLVEDPFNSRPLTDEEQMLTSDSHESSFKLQKNGVGYDIHTPTRKYFLSPQKPVIQSHDRAACTQYFDLRLSTDVQPNCSASLQTEFDSHMEDLRLNKSLVTVLGDDYLDFMKKLFSVDMSDFAREIFSIKPTSSNDCMKFMQQSYNDLCVNFNDPPNYSRSGERTLFVETFVQQFKLFSRMTRLLYFKWAEKKLQSSDHCWLLKKDFQKKDVQLKLLDGVGIMKKNDVNFIMLESSGVGDDILAHTLEDTLKNLKHGSDSLASILCDYKDCSIKTAKKIVVLTGHIIQNKMTILKYSPGPSGKWSVVETRSCTIPLKYENRMDSIKLYETFAYIYLTLKEQEEVYEKLSEEKLGLIPVAEEDMVRNSLYFL